MDGDGWETSTDARREMTGGGSCSLFFSFFFRDRCWCNGKHDGVWSLLFSVFIITLAIDLKSLCAPFHLLLSWMTLTLPA